MDLNRCTDGAISSSCQCVYVIKGNQINVSCDIYENQVKKTVNSNMKYVYNSQDN